MLGKLIKNEFINRGKYVIAVFSGLICFALVVALLWTINDSNLFDSVYFDFFLGIVTSAFVFGVFAAVVALIICSIDDFAKRLFKDQGYLTHTLPVKTSSIMLARMVFDVALFALIAIITPLASCIAARDFNFFRELFETVEEFLSSHLGSQAPAAIMDIILLVVGLLVSALAALWVFNASYAIGHSFNNNKKLLTVVAFAVISTINQLVMLTLMYIMDRTDIMDEIAYSSTFGGSTGDLVAIMVFMIFFIVINVISIAIYSVITSYICKKRLNLE